MQELRQTQLMVLVIITMVFFQSGMCDEKKSEPKRSTEIMYINPNVPNIKPLPYEGERYEALVPDTLDLAERAKLAINAMTEPTDANADYEVYWIVWFRSNPPAMMHNSWQFGGVEKFMWGLTIARLMSGSQQNLHVDQRWMEVALQRQGSDGLMYTPVEGRPWFSVWLPAVVEKAKLSGSEAEHEQLLSAFSCATMLSAMAQFAKRDSSQVWRDAMRKVVDGLAALAVDEGDVAYFWPSVFSASKEHTPVVQMPTSAAECESSVIPQGLVDAYRVLGYKPALELARKNINYLRRNFYGSDGSFLSSPGVPWRAHFHAHSRGLLAMEEYAETANDRELMEFVVRGYEYARGLGANERGDQFYRIVKIPGADFVGFFPEWVNSAGEQGGETCELADMIALALRLSKAGVRDYWDDADRWTRNQLAEAQLLTCDWIYRIDEKSVPSAIMSYSTTERVPERNIGAFAGSPSPNDWYSGNVAHGIGHCCTANGSKALYWIWESILNCNQGKLKVNLLLNRASPWADVDSYIPYQGRVDVKVKQAVDLSIRIPEWVTPPQAQCMVNGKEHNLGWDGRYAQVGPVKPGDVATLTFPIFERTDRVDIEKRQYVLVRKGNDVVSIEPPGRYCPLYQRQHYRDNTPRWRKVTRFVSKEHIDW